MRLLRYLFTTGRKWKEPSPSQDVEANSNQNALSFDVLTAKKQSCLLHLPAQQKPGLPAAHLSKFIASPRQILTTQSCTKPVAS